MMALVLAALVLGACGSDKKETKETPVSVQLNWTDDIAWSGFYMAEAKNHYADEKLKVDLRLAFDADGNYIDPLQEVASGRADFGVADGGELLQTRANGLPVVAIATIYQRHPLALVSFSDKEIQEPKDLVGARVQISAGNKVIFLALLKSQGIAPEDMTISDRTDYTIQPLINDESDVIDGWVTNEIVVLAEGGYEFNMILASDYGVENYPNVIFTSEDMIKNKPDVVERFLRSLLKGLQDAVDDPQGATDLTIARDSSLDAGFQAEGMQRSVPLVVVAGSQPGRMTPEIWQMTYQMLVDQNMLSAALDVTQAYTLDFLNKIYE
jgi:ABC-type nitrate/sulfonate/bicarbonate transport system substrate-binding protein